MFLVLFADEVEVAQGIGEGIEDTQGTAHIEVAAGEPSSIDLYYLLISYGQRKGPWVLNCI